MNIVLNPITPADLPFVKEVYDYYALNTTWVYFLKEVSIEQLKGFVPIGDPVYRSFVVRTDKGENAGFCYFSQFRPREAFRISVELTLYFKPEFTGKGYGGQVMVPMEEIIREAGFKNIMALITGENEASIRLFEKHGFERCANIRQVAEKFGKRCDLLMYQKLL